MSFFVEAYMTSQCMSFSAACIRHMTSQCMPFFAVCIHDEPVYVILRCMHTWSASVCHSSLQAYMTSPCMSFFAVNIYDEPVYVIVRCMHT